MEENILKFFDKVNLIISAIITGMTNLFGVQWILFAGYLLLNILDFITGCIKARINKTESSAVGLKGIIKKVCYWLLILVSFLTAYLLSIIGELLGLNIYYVLLFGWFTLACLLINEIRSILENLTEIGIEVPNFLSKGLKVVNNAINSKFDKKINMEDKNIEQTSEK